MVSKYSAARRGAEEIVGKHQGLDVMGLWAGVSRLKERVDLGTYILLPHGRSLFLFLNIASSPSPLPLHRSQSIRLELMRKPIFHSVVCYIVGSLFIRGKSEVS